MNVYLWRATFCILLILSLTGCTAALATQASQPVDPSQAKPTPQLVVSTQTPAPAASETSTMSATVTTIPTATLPPLNLTNPNMVELASNLPGPDDLLLAADKSIYISDVTDGTIKRYSPDGKISVLVAGLNEPEGMVFLPDGSLVIAEQGSNRLVRFDFKSKTLQPFLNLSNRTNQMGVDGITLDARPNQPESIIIPDSPNGVVLRASLDGKTVTRIAGGFARPTGAWVEPDGSTLIVDENAAALSRIRSDGSIQKLASLSIPDDVVEDAAGNIFVATIGDNAIHWISPAGQDHILVRRLSGPQGLIFDTDGNLLATDPGNHRLVKIIIR
ncbi:MAG: SMP-30/gluconolactonase/LRE family protein [Anaerolineaceae bacterium]|nr:SMP-30/gluconolactonase/LRE family protein [Anaerolineaceae bacterium]